VKGWIVLSLPLGLALAAGGRDVPRRTIAQPPQVRQSDALTAQIDAYLDARWAEKGLAPAEEVDDLAYARRLWLDLLGTIPSLEELRRLEARPAGGRQAWLVETAMSDPRFAETLAERLTRIAVGGGARPDDLLYRRRRMVSWLTGEIRRHRPWDELVREWISAEGLSTSSPAVNFVRSQAVDPVKLAARSTRAFLGIRIDCAQCHDHFFADWTQDQFEGLAAYFARIEQNVAGITEKTEGEYELEVHEIYEEELEEGEAPVEGEEPVAGEAMAMGESEPEVKTRVVAPSVPFGAEWVPEDAPTRRQALAAWITHPESPYFARAIVNRLWSQLMGRGIVEPVDELDVITDPVEGALLDLLSADLVENGFRLERTIRAIVSSRAYRLSSVLPDGGNEETLSALWALYPLKQLRARALGSAMFQATSFWTYDAQRAQLLRMIHFFQLNEFVNRRAEDTDSEVMEDESLLQRLQILNSKHFHERSKDDDIFGVAPRLQSLSPTNAEAIENAFLMALTRRPTPQEALPFLERLEAVDPKDGNGRAGVIADLLWALVNTTEFAWNH
jgi:hypothetical protein